MRRGLVALCLIALTVGCSEAAPGRSAGDSAPKTAGSSPAATAGRITAPPSTTESRPPSPSASPKPKMDARAALRDIRHLASEIGPREATSRNFAEAADFVEERFSDLGYDVRRTKVRVPAGTPGARRYAVEPQST
jgi:hypothetical protein